MHFNTIKNKDWVSMILSASASSLFNVLVRLKIKLLCAQAVFEDISLQLSQASNDLYK